MRTVLGSLAFIASLIAIHAIPGLVMAITPMWLLNAFIIFIFGILPILGFIKLAQYSRKLLKEEGKI